MTRIHHRLNLAAALFVLGTSITASADRVFPPHHLAPNANFPAGHASDLEFDAPWYERNSEAEREALVRNEIQESSPYPTRYYFVNIRNHANDESANLARYRVVQEPRGVRIADDSSGGDDNS